MSFLVSIGIVAGAVWLLALGVRGSMLAGCVSYLFACSCLNAEFGLFPVGALPLTIDRVWMGLLCGMYLVQRRVGGLSPKPVGKAEVLLAAFLGVLAVSSAVAGASLKTAGGGSAWWHLAIGYLFPAAIYWMARQSRLDQADVRGCSGFLTLFGLYLAATGICEMSGQWQLVWPGYIADPEVGLHYGRARGPMVQSVSYGLYVGVCLIVVLLRLKSSSGAGRFWLVGAAVMLAAAAALTLTRSVWMGTGLAVLLFCGLALDGTWRKLALGSMIAAGALLAATRMDSITGFQREGTASDTRSSAESRGGFAYVSWQMFLDRPLFGFGFGQFPQAKLPYLDERNSEHNLELIRPLSHHNTYLSLLVELGLLGLALYLGLLWCWFVAAWRLARDRFRPEWAQALGTLTVCALATYLVQMLFHDVTYTSIDHSLVYLLAGMTMGVSASSRAASSDRRQCVEAGRAAR